MLAVFQACPQFSVVCSFLELSALQPPLAVGQGLWHGLLSYQGLAGCTSCSAVLSNSVSHKKQPLFVPWIFIQTSLRVAITETKYMANLEASDIYCWPVFSQSISQGSISAESDQSEWEPRLAWICTHTSQNTPQIIAL